MSTETRRGVILGLLAVAAVCVGFAIYWADDWRRYGPR